jgi:selenide,water dikinase
MTPPAAAATASAPPDVTAFAGLRALAGCGGCAAKAPAELVSMLAGFAAGAGGPHADVLVGLAPFDDAAVYALDAERALIATVDFFPPLLDDPRDYGAIAAANAVSDVYAMGGSVAFALALAGFPAQVPDQVIADVSRAAADVVASCGGSVIGGHSVRCAEPVFGLCVIGFVHPAQIWRKGGARPGDVLMLSKPLGTGLLISAHRQPGLATAVASMRATNRDAAQALRGAQEAPHAVTDVSGYGLLGHAAEMAQQSAVTLRIEASRVPLLAGALEAAIAGTRTGAHRRAEARPAGSAVAGSARVSVRVTASVSDALHAVLEDPQTSGGLLASVSPSAVAALRAAGYVEIGRVERRAPGEGGADGSVIVD